MPGSAMLGAEGELTAVERAALALGRLNEHPEIKRLQYLFLSRVAKTWIRESIGPRLYVDGIERYLDWRPERGALFVSNHRSFFDQWSNMLALYERGATWPWQIYFPVRANFFYDHPAGILVNHLVGGGTMYPPFYRDRARADLNKDAIARVVRFLGQPDTLVGVHPEGTRNKGPDPYSFLKAQPGVGQIVLQARPIVVPFFIHGIGNDFFGEAVRTRKAGIRRENPVILVYGEPIDDALFPREAPRPALYKKTSDLLLEKVAELIPREKEIRRACAAGEITDDDPGWLFNGPPAP